MAKAKQLPSGSWRVQVYDKEAKKYRSFTSKLPGRAGKAEAELMAREYQLGRKKEAELGPTLGDCINEYIEMKEHILSPATIEGYRKERRNSLAALCDLRLSEITPQLVQSHINKLAITKSPKTIRNAHGLLVSVLSVYAPDIRLRTTLPKLQKKYKELPEVEQIMSAIINTEIELPCLLALWCSLRMSEIRGAKKSDIKDGVLTVRDTVITVRGEHIEKHATKTVESTRQILLPERIQDLIAALPEEQNNLTLLSGHAIYKRFSRILERAGLPHISFHDLRHINASVMLALGIPDKYAMERGGWSSDHIMKSVYQHTFSAGRQEADKKIDSYFSSVLDSINK